MFKNFKSRDFHNEPLSRRKLKDNFQENSGSMQLLKI